MTIGELKEYIYKHNKIEFILEKIGCHSIVYHQAKNYYSCANKNGDNKSAINVKNNKYLDVINWTRSEFDSSSDLITLIEYNKDISFIEAVKYIHEILDLPFELTRKESPKKKYDPLNIFKKNLRGYRRVVNVDDINFLDNKLLNDYVPYLHLSWLREGITDRTRKKFGVCYSYRKKRIIIPHRFWINGELVGFNERTVIQNYNEFGIPKYLLTKGYDKSLNIYGLYENYHSIKKSEYVVVYEAEKSVLKRDSLCDSTGVAISGHVLSDEQKRILIGLNTKEIIIAFDKDVNINEIRFVCEKFYRIRNVSYIYDKWSLLEEKQSPADVEKKIYDFLFKYRVPYDEKEHKEYLKSLNNK